MKIAILSKDAEYAKMLEYELADRGYCAFAYDGKSNADIVVCDIDSVDLENKVFAGIKLITFSKNDGAALKRPFAISTLCEFFSLNDNDNQAENIYPVLDARRRRLRYSAREITLSVLEARLYDELVSAKGEAVSNERLSALFKSQGGDGADRIRVLVCSLRRKIKNSFALDIIENVREMGYRIKMNK